MLMGRQKGKISTSLYIVKVLHARSGCQLKLKKNFINYLLFQHMRDTRKQLKDHRGCINFKRQGIDGQMNGSLNISHK